MYHSFPNSALVAGAVGGGGGGGGPVGDGVRLWLFIYCYIDIKLMKNEIDQTGSFIFIPST